MAATRASKLDPQALLFPYEAAMTEDEAKPLTLSREDLYELVWSKSMRELAKDFGISDVALAKRCRRLGIPVSRTWLLGASRCGPAAASPETPPTGSAMV